MSDFYNKINANLQKVAVDKNDRIVVAVSGGCDSMALVIALVKVGFKNIFPAIIDHQLRENSTQEAVNVSTYLQQFSLTTEVITWEHSDIISGIEEKARHARYNLLIEYCRKIESKTLFFAHHADDQFETFLLNISRGSGINGLTAMAIASLKNDIRVIRPMLNIKKLEIKNFLTTNHIIWFEDETNQDTKIRRNLLRSILENFNEDIDLLQSRVLNTINELQQLRVVLEKYQKENLKSITISSDDNSISLDVAKFSLLENIEKRNLLSEILTENGYHKDYRPRIAKIIRLVDDLEMAVINGRSIKRELNHCEISLCLKRNIILIFFP